MGYGVVWCVMPVRQGHSHKRWEVTAAATKTRHDEKRKRKAAGVVVVAAAVADGGAGVVDVVDDGRGIGTDYGVPVHNLDPVHDPGSDSG